jgi:hypothetical protein
MKSNSIAAQLDPDRVLEGAVLGCRFRQRADLVGRLAGRPSVSRAVGGCRRVVARPVYFGLHNDHGLPTDLGGQAVDLHFLCRGGGI